MQENPYYFVARWELKIPSPGIIVRYLPASLVMPNSYPRDAQSLKILIILAPNSIVAMDFPLGTVM